MDLLEKKSITFNCYNCKKKLKIPTDLAGKKDNCPNCNTLITAPSSENTNSHHKNYNNYLTKLSFTEKILIKCKTCKSVLKTKHRYIGLKSSCPKCNSQIQVVESPDLIKKENKKITHKKKNVKNDKKVKKKSLKQKKITKNRKTEKTPQRKKLQKLSSKNKKTISSFSSRKKPITDKNNLEKEEIRSVKKIFRTHSTHSTQKKSSPKNPIFVPRKFINNSTKHNTPPSHTKSHTNNNTKNKNIYPNITSTNSTNSPNSPNSPIPPNSAISKSSTPYNTNKKIFYNNNQKIKSAQANHENTNNLKEKPIIENKNISKYEKNQISQNNNLSLPLSQSENDDLNLFNKYKDLTRDLSLKELEEIITKKQTINIVKNDTTIRYDSKPILFHNELIKKPKNPNKKIDQVKLENEKIFSNKQKSGFNVNDTIIQNNNDSKNLQKSSKSKIKENKESLKEKQKPIPPLSEKSLNNQIDKKSKTKENKNSIFKKLITSLKSKKNKKLEKKKKKNPFKINPNYTKPKKTEKPFKIADKQKPKLIKKSKNPPLEKNNSNKKENPFKIFKPRPTQKNSELINSKPITDENPFKIAETHSNTPKKEKISLGISKQRQNNNYNHDKIPEKNTSEKEAVFFPNLLILIIIIIFTSILYLYNYRSIKKITPSSKTNTPKSAIIVEDINQNNIAVKTSSNFQNNTISKTKAETDFRAEKKINNKKNKIAYKNISKNINNLTKPGKKAALALEDIDNTLSNLDERPNKNKINISQIQKKEEKNLDKSLDLDYEEISKNYFNRPKSATDAITAFLNAPDFGSRVFHTLYANRLFDYMRHYSIENPFTPIEYDRIEQGNSGFIEKTKDKVYNFQIYLEENEENFPVPVVETENGYKVDWLAFIEFKDNLLKKFNQNKDNLNVYRVILRRLSTYYGNNFPNQEDYEAYKLNNYTPEYEGLTALVHKHNPIAQVLARKIDWNKDYFLTLKLKKKKFENGTEVILIDKIVSFSWLLKDILPYVNSSPTSSNSL